MHYYRNAMNTSSSSCCCCSNTKQLRSRKRARRRTLVVTTTAAALALFCVSTTAAFQPSALTTPVRSATTNTLLQASTVAPQETGLWGGAADHHPVSSSHKQRQVHHDPQHGGFHWPWGQRNNNKNNNESNHYDNHKKHSHKQQQSTSLLTPKDVWVQKYCTVEGLREAFGRNQNVLWGDLDATNTRRLYKTLMPVALMDLYHKTEGENDGDNDETATPAVQPQDLAVLAYKARVAAKLYARERCRVPARIAANLFDGYRQWRKYGSFDCTGMSYQQVWEKYAQLIQNESASDEDCSAKDAASSTTDDNDVTEQICLKILERSCQSNAMIDEMVLNRKQSKKQQTKKAQLQHLQNVQDQLEQDVRLLLLPPDSPVTDNNALLHHHNIRHWSAREAQKFRALRAFAKFKRRMAALQQLNHHHHHHNHHANNHNNHNHHSNNEPSQ